jgi:hypothetical protein
MPKEILSKDPIKQIAVTMSLDEAGLPKREAKVSSRFRSAAARSQESMETQTQRGTPKRGREASQEFNEKEVTHWGKR